MSVATSRPASDGTTWSGAPVFVHETLELPLHRERADAAWAELVRGGTMEALATTACIAGLAELTELTEPPELTALTGLADPTRRPGHAARLDLRLLNLPDGHRADLTVIPLRWRVAGWRYDDAPALDANLELSSPGPAVGRLTLAGTYRAPSRPEAQVWEPARLVRAAQVTARTFLSLLAAGVRPGNDG